MTDIVDKLRTLDEVVTFDGPWLRDAADEIERLRGLIREDLDQIKRLRAALAALQREAAP